MEDVENKKEKLLQILADVTHVNSTMDDEEFVKKVFALFNINKMLCTYEEARKMKIW